MFYLTCRFKKQADFMEAMQLLTEYSVEVSDFGKEEDPPELMDAPKRIRRNRGREVKLGSRSSLNRLGPVTQGYFKTAQKILKAQEGGKLKRTTLGRLIGKEHGKEQGSISPALTVLIRKGYLIEVSPSS